MLLLALAACLVLLIATLVTAVVGVSRASRHNDEVLQRVESLGRRGRIEDALAAARELGGSVAIVIVAGLTGLDDPSGERAIRDAARSQLQPFERQVRYLEWIGAAAVFAAAAGLPGVAGGRDGGVAGAGNGALHLVLWTAALGLAIAIVATVGRFWLLARLSRLASDMEKGALVVYNTAR